MYKRYEKMKDSGVEWIGEIPEHWTIQRIKHFYKIINGSTPQSTERSYWDGEIIWVTPDDLGKLKNKYIDDSSRKITEDGYNSCGTSLVSVNSIVLSTRAPIGHMAIASTTLCTNQGCKTLEPAREVNSSYSYYFLHSSKHILQSLGTGTTFIELGRDELSTFNIPCIPLPEQKAIAAFLDRETSRIDKLIEKKERHIELLKEKRQALITRAVTRGLDPSVKMKDSGVEWIGEIPEHWKVLPGFTVFEEQKVKNNNMQEDNLLSLSYGNIIQRDIETNFGLLPESFETYQIVYPGNIILRLTDLQNDKRSLRTGLVKEQGIITSAYICLKLKKSMLGEYAYLLLHSYDIQKVFYNLGGGVRQSMKFEELRRLDILVPPISEQSTIVKYVDKSTTNIDSLVKKIQIQIDKLRELRQTLISDAVTGKIDVRDYVSSEEIAGMSSRKLEVNA